MKKIVPLVLLFLTSCLQSQEQVTTAPIEILTKIDVPTPENIIVEMDTADISAEDGFLRLCQRHSLLSPSILSPNGLWLVESCYSNIDQGVIMVLSENETQITWKLLYREYSPKSDLVLDGGMRVAHWTKDGRYAYFLSFMNASGGGCFMQNRISGWGLFRLDLDSGETKTIVPLGEYFHWYVFSFSPTDEQLVFGFHAKDYKVLDITTGTTIPVNPVKSYDEGGGIIWSEDGQEFVYSTVFDSADSGYETVVRLVNAQSGVEEVLLEDKDNCYVAREWKKDNILVVDSFDEPTTFMYDLELRTVIP